MSSSGTPAEHTLRSEAVPSSTGGHRLWFPALTIGAEVGPAPNINHTTHPLALAFFLSPISRGTLTLRHVVGSLL